MLFLNKNSAFFFILFSIAFLSCSEEEQSFATLVENAHHKTEFLDHEAVAFDLVLYFGGTERFNGTITWATNSSKGLLEYNGGLRIDVVEDKISYNDTSATEEKARFTAYTWSYFFMLPYKLTDPGTVWNDYENKDLNGRAYEVEKLTFESGIGDAPDDWYVVYADPETKLMHVASYIVTATKTLEEAEEDPHAIKYEDYKEVEGIPIAHKWTFWGWNTEDGLTEELGNAEISNIKFLSMF